MANLIGQSTDPNVAGTLGENTADGNGIAGISTSGIGVWGTSQSNDAVVGDAQVAGKSGVFGKNNSAGGNGVAGFSQEGIGVSGVSQSNDGVRAFSTNGNGLSAFSDTNTGIYAKAPINAGYFDGNVYATGTITAKSEKGIGIVGTSKNNDAVIGDAQVAGKSGVFGKNDVAGGNGVAGFSKDGTGIAGGSTNFNGVAGNSEKGIGVLGTSKNNDAVVGDAQVAGKSGVFGKNDVAGGNGVAGFSKGGIGVSGVSQSSDGVRAFSTNGNGLSAFSDTNTGIYAKAPVNAGYFDGNVYVTGNLVVKTDIYLANADCAEDFDIIGLEKVAPGTVMVIESEGALQPSSQAYDKRVAGVISGAGLYKPGLILDKQESSNNRMPIALMGKVYCKVDASYGAIEVGDLLTTSSTPGHAMKVSDSTKAPGSVIGKALRPLKEGQKLIPILIALQ